MTLSLDATVRVPDDVVFRELDGEAVVLNLESGMYFGLDEVGTRIWRLVEEHRSLRPALEALEVEFDAASDQAECSAAVASACDAPRFAASVASRDAPSRRTRARSAGDIAGGRSATNVPSPRRASTMPASARR